MEFEALLGCFFVAAAVPLSVLIAYGVPAWLGRGRVDDEE